jgi:hypothetical protein
MFKSYRPMLDWYIGCTQISTWVLIWVWKYLTSWVWFALHIAIVCENWIPWLILNSTGKNILGALIYIHTQLFMSINAMVGVSTFLRCKVWVVNCKLFNMVGSCYIIVEGTSSMWVAWCKNRAWKSDVIEEEVSPLGASMCMVPCSINLIGISKLEKRKTKLLTTTTHNIFHSSCLEFNILPKCQFVCASLWSYGSWCHYCGVHSLL